METTAPARPEWNTGGGDHDKLYVWGLTDLYLIPQERGLLRPLRSDIQHGKFADDMIPEPTPQEN